MSASLAIGIAATIIALVGLGFTALERRDRRRADVAERETRTEEIALVRRQVAASERRTELDEAAHEAARSADVRVLRGGRDGLGWSFDLVNTGPAVANSVHAWLSRAEDEVPVSVTLELAGPLLPGAATEGRRLLIPLSEEFIKSGPSLVLVLAWDDTRRRMRRDEYHVDL